MPEEHIALLAALFPNDRLIFMVRNPVDRAWSHIKHVGLGWRGGDLHHLSANVPANINLAEIISCDTQATCLAGVDISLRTNSTL